MLELALRLSLMASAVSLLQSITTWSSGDDSLPGCCCGAGRNAALVHDTESGLAQGISLRFGASIHTHRHESEALREALERWHFDAAWAERQDAMKRRAGPRSGIFSTSQRARRGIRGKQRPASYWRLFNTRIKPG
jgi:hypothetical protein